MPSPTLVPHLVVPDGEAAITFYEKALGATLESRMPADDGRRLMHAHLTIGNGSLFLMDDFPEYREYNRARTPADLGGASSVVHIEVDDADAAWTQAVAAGVTVIMELGNQFWERGTESSPTRSGISGRSADR